jgi:serine/threonine-protein kinase
VVHRDIKPENVLLSGGAAVVTDFGIAKALSASKTQAPGGTLTVVGTSLGTPAYMAPEQAVGDHVDERADIYAWGVIGYELLAGAHPFSGRNTAQQLIAAHIAEQPGDLRELHPGVPPALATLVMRCMEKDPSGRPQSATEVLHAMEDPALTGTANAMPVAAARSRSVRWLPRALATLLGVIVLGGRDARARSHRVAAASAGLRGERDGKRRGFERDQDGGSAVRESWRQRRRVFRGWNDRRSARQAHRDAEPGSDCAVEL